MSELGRRDFDPTVIYQRSPSLLIAREHLMAERASLLDDQPQAGAGRIPG